VPITGHTANGKGGTPGDAALCSIVLERVMGITYDNQPFD